MVSNSNSVLSEKPKKKAQLEWWYFHGELDKPDGNCISFMFSLFRQKTKLASIPDGNCFSAIMSVCDHSAGSSSFRSVISKSFLNNFIHNKNEAFRSRIEDGMLRLIFEDFKKNGPPKPIMVSDQEVLSSKDILSIDWDDITLEQNKKGFQLGFSMGADNVIDLQFVPKKNMVSFPTNPLNSRNGMYYNCYPQMDIEGTLNGQKVTGNAWMDHQWGGYSWFFKDENERRIRGWDWYSFNDSFDRTYMFIFRRYADDGSLYSKKLFIVQPDQTLKEVYDIELENKTYWTSSRTSVRYPLEVSLQTKSLGLQLVFTPLISDQEIQVFYPIRSIWQGAGVFSGEIDGNPIEAKGRAELHSYGYLFKFEDYLKGISEKVNHSLERFLPKAFDDSDMERFIGKPDWKHEPEAYNQMISEPLWDLISRNGKKWRPVFAHLLISAMGVDPKPYEDLLFVITELIHTASLIIDDIEDESAIRRGKQSIHTKYGESLAINAANTTYFLPTLMIFDHTELNEEQKLGMQEILMRQFVKAHFGQSLDLFWSKELNQDNLDSWLNDSIEDKILQMYTMKTAAPIQGLAEAAVTISKKDEGMKRAARKFARDLGVAFQIIDDIHNFSDSDKWRKCCGEDLLEGKLTYVIVKALKRCGKEDRKILYQLLLQKDLTANDELFKKGVEIIRGSGTLEECREIAKNLIIPAWLNLDPLLDKNESRLFLRLLSSYLVEMEL